MNGFKEIHALVILKGPRWIKFTWPGPKKLITVTLPVVQMVTLQTTVTVWAQTRLQGHYNFYLNLTLS